MLANDNDYHYDSDVVKESQSKTCRYIWRLRMKVNAASVPRFFQDSGFSLRPFERGVDEHIWLDVNNFAFAGHPDQGNWNYGKLHSRMDEAWFRHERFILCFKEEELAGFIWNKSVKEEFSQVGEIHIIAVSPHHQNCGLGRALVKQSLAMMHEDGFDEAIVYTDETNTVAIRLYESVGFSLEVIEPAK